MKIQLDTTNKTIKLESDVLFSELIEVLEKLLPKGLWKEFELKTNVTITTWSNPIIIEKYHEPYRRYPWWNDNGTISKNDNITYCQANNLVEGKFNIEANN